MNRKFYNIINDLFLIKKLIYIKLIIEIDLY